MDTPTETPAPELWAIVSQMGHVTFAGKITEEEKFGGKLGRCDCPQADGTVVTRYFTAQSLYSLIPCAEAVARARCGIMPEPVSPLQLPEPEPEDRDEGDFEP